MKRQHVLQGQGIGDEIVVGQHGALGAAGRARGVEDRRQVIARPLHRLERVCGIGCGIREGSLPFGVERFDGCSHLCGELSDPVPLARIADHQ